MTKDEEIQAWSALVNSWKKDAKHYEAGLKKIRKFAMANSQDETVKMINDILAFEGEDSYVTKVNASLE